MMEDRRSVQQKLYDSNAAMYVLGYVMEQPAALRGEKYFLTTNDFVKAGHQIIFGALYNLAQQGAEQIFPQDVDLYVAQYVEQYNIYTQDNGLNFLMQLEKNNFGRDEAQFQLHYEKMKKFTILRDLERAGFDTKAVYNRDVDFLSIEEEVVKLNKLSLTEIIDRFRVKLVKIEKGNINKSDQYFQTAAKGLRQLVEDFKTYPDVGSEMDGEMLNYILRGARPGKLYLISMPQGHGKTRTMVGNACKAAFPYIENGKVVKGDLQKVLYIATEQLPDEIQTLILSFVSGVDEEKILRGTLTNSEELLLEQAIQIIEQYQENFLIDVLVSPNIPEMRSKILEPVLNKGVESVYFDYIFVPTNDDPTTSRRDLRVDQLLMLTSNALKEVAAMYDVFIMTGTQVNGMLKCQ